MLAESVHKKLFVSVILQGKYLNPQAVTDKFGIIPSKSFARGDLRPGGKKWPHGYWALESSAYVESTDLADHLEWLINKLGTVEQQLIELLNDDTVSGAKISCFWIMSGEHESLTLTDELLAKVARLKLSVEFEIYSPS